MDPGRTPVVCLVRGKIAIYNERLRMSAARHGCEVVDPWALTPLRDPRAWGQDRVHLSPAGHDRVARLVAQLLGLPTLDPYAGWDHPAVCKTRRDDLQWTREFFLPWRGRLTPPLTAVSTEQPPHPTARRGNYHAAASPHPPTR